MPNEEFAMENLRTNENQVREQARQDREAIRIVTKRINESPAAARKFLIEAGIATAKGKLRRVYR